MKTLQMLMIAVILASLLLRPSAVQACEVALPANYLFSEMYAFASAALPSGLSANADAPQRYLNEGLTGYLRLQNDGAADLYLLPAYLLTDVELMDGQAIGGELWGQAVKIGRNEALELYGEGDIALYATNFKPRNFNNPEGSAEVPSGMPADQRSQLNIVNNQKLVIVPFTQTLTLNPAYKPEGTFHRYTVAEQAELAPYIVQAVSLHTVGYDNTSGDFRVVKWLKGSGPVEITIDGFGATSCDYQMDSDGERIFFVAGDIERGEMMLHDFQPGMFDAIVGIENAAEIRRVVGQEPIVFDSAASSPTLNAPATSQPTSANISTPTSGLPTTSSIALIALTILIIGAVFFRMKWR